MKKLKENKVLSLAIPATIENILQTLVGFIDTMMISRIGLLAVTAVGVTNTILNVYLAVFIALGVGASALIAQYLGANKEKESQKITNQSVVLALVVGLIFSLVSLFFWKTVVSDYGSFR
ncbi:MatE protein [Marinilactibacillus piezotolerans]|uniref:Probable multidrug resistance protein NorM n=1 Tax=Marinilactibacillus piezotolerans TaxID=258723 RepID=A0A1I3ZNC2_9LACT|nr:MatE protein [Marinilactibacillus piezotolerans]